MCLFRWQSMTISGQRRMPWWALQPPLMTRIGKVTPYQRATPASMWQSTPCSWAASNKDTGTSSDNQMGLSLRWDINVYNNPITYMPTTYSKKTTWLYTILCIYRFLFLFFCWKYEKHKFCLTILMINLLYDISGGIECNSLCRMKRTISPLHYSPHYRN